MANTKKTAEKKAAPKKEKKRSCSKNKTTLEW